MTEDFSIYKPFVEAALKEDIGRGDITTNLLFPYPVPGEGVIRARCRGVMAGGPVAALVFQTLNPGCSVKCVIAEGNPFGEESDLLWIRGDARGILSGERVALNFLQRLCGIATMTREYVNATKGQKVQIVDTRKTLPGWRLLDKYAVRCGGGSNHRFGLDDGILIKDNHLALITVEEAVRRGKKNSPHFLKIEVEVENLEQAKEAIHSGAEVLLLDNMSPADMKAVVDWAKGCVFLEASGGVTLENVREIASTGVDYISVGALTHSPPSLDLSLEVAKRN
ncbi:MAG TPA: carboxylating nicotinate-nucleotide diphosphorylase [Nitrospiria bacterium]|jgi:nicotinate-nucleotide pyrophosphorylase (carboxylating)